MKTLRRVALAIVALLTLILILCGTIVIGSLAPASERIAPMSDTSNTSQFPLRLPEPTERKSEKQAEETTKAESDATIAPSNIHPVWGPVGGRDPNSEGNR